MPSPSEAAFDGPPADSATRLEFAYNPSAEVCKSISDSLAPYTAIAQGPRVRFAALTPSADPVGRYRLITEDGTWFVRVSSRWGNPELEASLIDYLVKKAVPTNALLVAGAPLRWLGRTHRVDVRPNIEGEHQHHSIDDLTKLSATVSGCHEALCGFSRADEIHSAARRRYSRLVEVRDQIGAALHGDIDLFEERSPWALHHRDWLVEMVECFDPHLEEYPDAQCLHGEIHPGNVLFRSTDRLPVLLDFEESVKTFAPRAWDLAFLFQRYCLSDHPSPTIAIQRVQAIAEGYGADLPPLAQMMRTAAWLSVATLVDWRASKGIVSPVSEYDKFVRLEQQAREYEGIL